MLKENERAVRVTEQSATFRSGFQVTTYYSRSDGTTLVEYSDKTWGVKVASVWLPGKYATREAALAAVNCPLNSLRKMTHHTVRGAGKNYRPVTLDELLQLLGRKGAQG